MALFVFAEDHGLMNVMVRPAIGLAKVGVSAGSAGEMKDSTSGTPWRLHSLYIKEGAIRRREVQWARTTSMSFTVFRDRFAPCAMLFAL